MNWSYSLTVFPSARPLLIESLRKDFCSYLNIYLWLALSQYMYIQQYKIDFLYLVEDSKTSQFLASYFLPYRFYILVSYLGETKKGQDLLDVYHLAVLVSATAVGVLCPRCLGLTTPWLTSNQESHWPCSADHWVPGLDGTETQSWYARHLSSLAMLVAGLLGHLGNLRSLGACKPKVLGGENTWGSAGPSRDCKTGWSHRKRVQTSKEQMEWWQDDEKPQLKVRFRNKKEHKNLRGRKVSDTMEARTKC